MATVARACFDLASHRPVKKNGLAFRANQIGAFRSFNFEPDKAAVTVRRIEGGTIGVHRSIMRLKHEAPDIRGTAVPK